MKKFIVLVLGLTLVAASCNKSQPPATGNNTTTTSSDVKSGTVEIDITSSGYSPSAVTVKAGTVVVFKNMDSQLHWPASDPHPTHTGLPGFDANQALTLGASYSNTFTKVGTWKFHDHLSPELRGTVTVE